MKCLHRNLCMTVHSRVLHNSQKVESIQMSLNWWWHKQTGVSTQRKTGHERNEALIMLNMDEPWKQTKWKKPDPKGHIPCDSVWNVRNRQSIETKSWLLSRDQRGRGKWEWVLIGIVSFWGDENVLEFDSHNGHTALWVYWRPVNCTLLFHFLFFAAKSFIVVFGPMHGRKLQGG